MSAYTEFFLSGLRSAVQLELLEISHPNFLHTYRKVRNARKGVTVTLEDSTSKTFDYLPMKLTNLGTRDDLDSGVGVSFGDLGKIIPKELTRIKEEDGFDTPPTVKYRTYSSNNLTAPLFGPINLEIKTFSTKREGCSFEAKAPQLNYSATGMLYKLDRFPMLRGAL